MNMPTIEELFALCTEILSYFPDRETLEALKADKGYGYRFMPLLTTPKDDVLDRWLKTLGR